MPYVYILQCDDGLYYTGMTKNLTNRLSEHNAGKATFTASRRPVKLVYTEFIADASEAARREAQIKDWSRVKKEALIEGQLSNLALLAKKHF